MSVDNLSWCVSSTRPTLTSADVHIWQATLADAVPYLDHLISILSADELARAEQFHFVRDKQQFLARRALLRIILAAYSSNPPSELKFEYGIHGKPRISALNKTQQIEFNASYSNELALFAISLGRPVGIDLEHIRPLPEMSQIVRICFTESEKHKFESLIDEQQLTAFYKYWTCKEAFLKATGCGLSYAMNWFEVSVSPWASPQLLAIDCNEEQVDKWAMLDLKMQHGYVASLVTEAANLEAVCLGCMSEMVHEFLNQ